MMSTGRGLAPRIRAIAALGVLVGAALAGCRDQAETPPPLAEPTRPPSEGIRGVSLSSYRVGDTRWILRADTASVYRDKKRVEAEVVRVDFYEEDEHVSVLTADTGILIQTTDDLEARGNVQVVTDEGAVLETEVLFWDHGQSRIHTEAFVKVTRGENVLTGIGLEADPGLDRIDLKREIRGTIREVPEEVLEEEDVATGSEEAE
jgi:LPS export ABC transporter protein LptC